MAPLAEAPSIDGVFFDAVNYGYDIPEVIVSIAMVSVRGSAVEYDGYKMGGWVDGLVGRWTGFVSIPCHPIHPSILLPYLSEVRPWGKPVLNVPNCSTPVAQGGAVGWGGCEALLNGTLDVLRRTTQLLNSRGKVMLLAAPRCSSPTPCSLFHPLAPPDLLTPLTLSEPHAQEPAAPCLQAATLVLQVPLFANPASFARPPGQKIWLDEVRPMPSYTYTADVVSALRALHCIVCHIHIRTAPRGASHGAPGSSSTSPSRRGSWQRCRGCSGQPTTRGSEATPRSTPRPTTSRTCARR